MAEKNVFSGGSANASTQNKPKEEDSKRVDEYGGSYKDAAAGLSEAEKFGTSENPAQAEKLPAKNLKGVGG